MTNCKTHHIANKLQKKFEEKQKIFELLKTSVSDLFFYKINFIFFFDALLTEATLKINFLNFKKTTRLQRTSEYKPAHY